MRFFLSNKKGFTMIELIVAFAIIGILVTIVYASVGESRKKARDVQRVSDLQQVQLALRLYKDVHGFYPGFQNDGSGTFVPTGEYDSGVSINALASAGGPLAPYFSAALGDPLGGEYYYATNIDCGGLSVIIVATQMETKHAFEDNPETEADNAKFGNWSARGCNVDQVSFGPITLDEDTYVTILQTYAP